MVLGVLSYQSRIVCGLTWRWQVTPLPGKCGRGVDLEATSFVTALIQTPPRSGLFSITTRLRPYLFFATLPSLNLHFQFLLTSFAFCTNIPRSRCRNSYPELYQTTLHHPSTTHIFTMGLSAELKTPVTGTYTQPTGLFIDNEWVEAVDKKTFEVVNPSTEEVIVSVSEATEKDVDIAVAAARKAFNGVWRQTTPGQRSIYLLKLAELVEKNIDLLAAVESLDNGKSITMAKGDVGAVVGCIRYYGGWADKIEGKTIDVAPDMFHYTRQEPIGVCGQIIPWNFPILMLAWKIAPALATGNTVVMKTAEQTPLSGLVFANLVKEAGFPPGVFNLINGFGKVAGAAISSHMDIDKVAFTGSTLAGTVWVNCYNMLHHQVPFGGFKESGIGRELGEAALSNYTQNKSVRVSDANTLWSAKEPSADFDSAFCIADMSSYHQRSTSQTGGPEKTYFEQQREVLIGEIAMSFEHVLANINKLNRSLEAVTAVGNEFSSVEALWSQFENVMAKEPTEDNGSKSGSKPANESPSRRDDQRNDEDDQ
ncbi:hypothetical protein BN1708_001492 [Verticillium longisporum]|uniref:aldehyde dehydrogenase (NAD(+)) n=1 Tax=Verticillium longisporum TaxID=100787 RepID=A0A0G4MT61_VERLO|nr:hypothetical protein BN1708_001492 [Verticillium longisporum]